MKTIKKILMLVSVGVLLTLSISPAQAKAPKREVIEYTIPELVKHFTDLYGSDYDLVMSIIFEESGFRMVCGDSGKSCGMAQYNRDTFKRHSKALGEELNYDSAFDQIKLISFAFSHSEAYRMEWTTYRAIKNGGTYTFTDKNGKQHTVHAELKDW